MPPLVAPVTFPDWQQTEAGILVPPIGVDPRLDALPSFDDASRDFPIRALLAPGLVPRSYTWRCAVHLNQGLRGRCCGYAVATEIAARPVVLPATNLLGDALYREAQQLDEWPGENYEGTSVLAAMKAAKARGYFAEYRWAFSPEDLLLAIGYHGPAILGINWYEGMSVPNAINGMIRVSGAIKGRHAICANAVRCAWPRGLAVQARAYANLDVDRTLVKWHNTWGIEWGLSGECWITLRDLQYLLAGVNFGEAAIPVQRTAPPA